MIIRCPSCRARYRIDEKKTARSVARVKCPKCGHGFEVTVAPAVEERRAEGQGGLDARTIVVVDDARFFREVIADILAPLKYSLHLAASGEEGLPLLRQLRPALVILDLKLPGMSGLELIRMIRADASLSGIKILAMSSVYRREDEVHKIILAGADEFLNKSFKSEHLLSRVKQMMSS